LIVRAADAAPGHLVEGGLDKFFVVDSLFSSIKENVLSENTLSAFPNPFTQSLQLNWSLTKEIVSEAYILVSDISGRIIKKMPLKSKEGSVVFNDEIAEGIYFARLVQDNKISKLVKIVKVK
jgi:hypothetical protein